MSHLVAQSAVWDTQGNYITEVKDDINKQLTFNGDRSQFINIDGNKLRLFDVTNISNKFDIVNKFILIQGNPFGIRNFSRDSNRILTRGKDQKTLQLFDLQGNPIGEPLKLKPNDENGYINNDLKKIVIADSKAKRRRIFDFSGKLNADIEGIDTTFNKDGTRIATRLGNKILLWDAQGNRMGSEVETGLSESERKDIHFSGDGKKLIVIAEKKLQIWDLDGRQKVVKDTKRAFFDNNSNILITVDANNVVKCWDLKGSLIKKINVKLSDNDDISFSRDGKYFLTVSGDADNRKAQIWDMKGNLIRSPKQSSIGISRAEFSFDGKQLITFYKDHTVKIWNIAGTLTTELKGHTGDLNGASISPDGNKIMTSSSTDKTIRVWNTTGNLIGIISSSSEVTFYAANFSADGSKIIALTSDNEVRIYDNNFVTDYEQLWQLGCKKLEDYLTYNPKVTEEDRKMCDIAAKQQ